MILHGLIAADTLPKLSGPGADMYVLGNALHDDDDAIIGRFSKHIAAVYAMWSLTGDSNGLGYRLLSADDLAVLQKIKDAKCNATESASVESQTKPCLTKAVDDAKFATVSTAVYNTLSGATDGDGSAGMSIQAWA